MTSPLSRDDLAARFAVADYGARCAAYYAGAESDTILGTAVEAYKMADAFLAERDRQRPAAPVPPASDTPPAAPTQYVPKKGDVVGIDGGKEYGETRVVVGIDGDRVEYVRLNTNGDVLCRHNQHPSMLQYLRPATASERKAAGLPEDAAPDAPPVPPAATAPDFTEDDIDALAAKMHFGWYTTRGLTVVPWGDVSFDGRKSWRDAAEAALAWFRSRGAKS